MVIVGSNRDIRPRGTGSARPAFDIDRVHRGYERAHGQLPRAGTCDGQGQALVWTRPYSNHDAREPDTDRANPGSSPGRTDSRLAMIREERHATCNPP